MPLKRALPAISTQAVVATATLVHPVKRQRARQTWNCPHCSTVIVHESQGNLLRHIRQQHGIGVSSCIVCDECFPNPQQLMKHVQANPHCTAVTSVASVASVASGTSTASSSSPTTETVKTLWSDFYAWCCEVPTAHEKDIKKKPMTKKAIRCLERDVALFIDVCHQLQPGVFSATGPRPGILTHDPLVRHLLDYFRNQRTTRPRSKHQIVGISASRLIEVCTGLKKVVAYVCNRLSRDSGVYVQRNRFEAHTTVSNVSSEACGLLKQRRQNNKQLVADEVLSAEEMFTVGRTCVQRLSAHAAQHPAGSKKKKHKTYFKRHLIVAVLILCMAPRSQCIHDLTELEILPTATDSQPFVRSLYVPHSPGNGTDQYVISLPAQTQKNQSPWKMIVPALLTPLLNYWRKHYCLPGQRWVFMAEQSSRKRATTVMTEAEGPFGVKPGQGPRGCSRFVRPVTKSIIDKEVNAHSLRHTTATLFDKANLTNDERRYLALVAQHNIVIHEGTYTHHEFNAHIAKFQQILLEGVSGK